MSENLIIGSSSQLAQYFPVYYERVSSRNIDFNYFEERYYDRIYFTFAEQRTYNKSLLLKDFAAINVTYTLRLIDFFSSRCNKLIIYGTSELFNKYNGPVDINMPFNYYYSPYTESKAILLYDIKYFRSINLYNNIIVIHPFNFNSIHRKPGFLFHKILDSLINSNKNKINNINFHRDMVHASYVAKQSILASQDCLIGSGKLIDIEDFVKDLFKCYGKNYLYYLKINNNMAMDHNFWYDTKNIYNTLLQNFLSDIETNKHVLP